MVCLLSAPGVYSDLSVVQRCLADATSIALKEAGCAHLNEGNGSSVIATALGGGGDGHGAGEQVQVSRGGLVVGTPLAASSHERLSVSSTACFCSELSGFVCCACAVLTTCRVFVSSDAGFCVCFFFSSYVLPSPSIAR